MAVVVATLIFVEDFQCRRKQRYHYFSVGLLAVGDYPKTTVEHLLDIIDAQVGEVDVCKPGEAGEDEDVTYLFQAFACKLLLHHLAQFVFCQVSTVNTLDGDFVAVEGVNGNKPGTDGFVDYLFEELHTLVCGVLRVFILGAQEELQIDDELVLDFTQGNVGDVVFLFHELHHTSVHALVFLIGGVRLAQSDELLGVFKMLLLERHQRFFFRGNAGKGVLYHFGCNVAVTVEDVVVVFFKNVAHILNALVELGNF